MSHSLPNRTEILIFLYLEGVMAEHGAQLSSAVRLNASRPSIFEVLAQESLLTSIRPALKHTFRVLATSNVEGYGWMYRWSDEICTLLQLLLDAYHLKNYDASFSENFYGLKRVPEVLTETQDAALQGNKIQTSTGLSSSVIIKSLVLLIGYPYVKSKLNAYYEKLTEQYGNNSYSSTSSSSNQNLSLRQKLTRLFVTLYPYIHGSLEAAVFLHQVSYVFGLTRHHSPWLRLAGVTLSHITLQDMERHEASAALPRLMDELMGKSILKKVSLILKRLVRYIVVILSSGLSVGVFFLQFLDWWYASDQRNSSLMSLPKPDPPQAYTADKLTCSLPRLNSICPLCQKMRSNDTALAVSGYVFCYPCIHRFVSQRSRCPITGCPAQLSHLVKLFTSS